MGAVIIAAGVVGLGGGGVWERAYLFTLVCI